MYQSGQFIHYRALREDWTQEDSWIPKEFKLAPMKFLGVLSTIYLITEIFEFLSRIGNEGLCKEGVNVSIVLEKTREENCI